MRKQPECAGGRAIHRLSARLLQLATNLLIRGAAVRKKKPLGERRVLINGIVYGFVPLILPGAEPTAVGAEARTLPSSPITSVVICPF